MMKTERIPADQLPEFENQTDEFEAFVLGPLGDSLKYRWIVYHEILPLVRRAGFTAAQVLGTELADAHREMNDATIKVANMVKGLESQKLGLAWFVEQDEVGALSAPIMSVVRTDKIPPDDLGAFFTVPLIFYTVVGVALSAGFIYLWNSDKTLLRMHLENERLIAETAARKITVLEELQKRNPTAAAAFAEEWIRAEAKANATKTGAWYDRIGRSIERGSPFFAIGLLIALMMLTTRKK